MPQREELVSLLHVTANLLNAPVAVEAPESSRANNPGAVRDLVIWRVLVGYFPLSSMVLERRVR